MNRIVYYESPVGGMYPVNLGFSWMAFLFGPLWALVKRAWLIAVLLGLVLAVLGFVEERYVKGKGNLVSLAMILGAYVTYMLVCGVKGGSWLVWTYESRGFKRAGDA